MAFNRIIYRSFRLFICSYISINRWGLCCWNSPLSISLLRNFFSNIFFYTVVIHFIPGTFHFLTEPGIFCCALVLRRKISANVPVYDAPNRKRTQAFPLLNMSRGSCLYRSYSRQQIRRNMTCEICSCSGSIIIIFLDSFQKSWTCDVNNVVLVHHVQIQVQVQVGNTIRSTATTRKRLTLEQRVFCPPALPKNLGSFLAALRNRLQQLYWSDVYNVSSCTKYVTFNVN